MPGFDVKEYLKTYLKSRLGDPVVNVVEQDENAIEVAVTNASLNFWTAFPHKHLQEVEVGFSCPTEYSFTFDELKDAAFTDPDLKADAYLLGIVRLSEVARGSAVRNFDSLLLGVPASYPYYKPVGLAGGLSIDINRILQDNTEADIVGGETDIEYDEVNQKVTLIVPPFFNQLQVWFGWGFVGSRTPSLIPMRHMQLFRDMVTFEYLDIVAKARSAITVNADFTVDVGEITRQRDELKQQIEETILLQIEDWAGSWG